MHSHRTSEFGHRFRRIRARAVSSDAVRREHCLVSRVRCDWSLEIQHWQILHLVYYFALRGFGPCPGGLGAGRPRGASSVFGGRCTHAPRRPISPPRGTERMYVCTFKSTQLPATHVHAVECSTLQLYTYSVHRTPYARQVGLRWAGTRDAAAAR